MKLNFSDTVNKFLAMSVNRLVGHLLKTLVYFFRKVPGTFLTTSLNGLIHNLSRGYFSPSAQVQ